MMEEIITGWVVVYNGNKIRIDTYTFARTRKEAIQNFLGTWSNQSWEYWKKKFNYSVVRATQTINI